MVTRWCAPPREWLRCYATTACATCEHATYDPAVPASDEERQVERRRGAGAGEGSEAPCVLCVYVCRSTGQSTLDASRRMRSPGQMSGITLWSIDHQRRHSSRPPQAAPDRARSRHKATPPDSSAVKCHATHSKARGQSLPRVPHCGAHNPTAPLGQRTATKFWLGGAVIDDAGRRCWVGAQSTAAANPHRHCGRSLQSQRDRMPLHAPRRPPFCAPFGQLRGAPGKEGLACPPGLRPKVVGRPSDRRRRAARADPPTGCVRLACLGWVHVRWMGRVLV